MRPADHYFSAHDRWGHEKSDLRLLILGVLCVLAQHLPFDLVYELNDITGDKNNKFFKQFVEWLGTKKFEEKVKFPETEEETRGPSQPWQVCSSAWR
jgi:hypothetical protein